MRNCISFALIALCFQLAGCSAQSPRITKKHLSISEATATQWAPGIVKNQVGQAGGIIYELKLTAKKSGQFQFTSFIVDDQVLSIDSLRSGSFQQYNKGDSIILKIRSDRENEPARPNAALKEILSKSNIEAGVAYTFKGHDHLLSIPKISKKKPYVLNK